MTKKTTKKVKEEKKSLIQLIWEKKKNRISKSKVLVNGFLFTCIILSISSGIVDITCLSGLSKSYFHLGTIPVAAALLYTAISFGLTSLKFWCVMYIGMLKELRSKLLAKNFDWGNDISKPIIRWQIIHKALIFLSIMTAINMSVNSIGSGIRKMQQNIDNMTADSLTLIELNKSVNEGIKEKRNAGKENIRGTLNARNDAKDEVERYYQILVKYQTEYQALSDEEKDGAEGKKIITKIVKEIPGTSNKNAIYFSKADLQKSIQKIATDNEVIDNSSLYEDAIIYDQKQISDTLLAIADKNYKTPDGKEILFLDSEGQPINIQLAISRLQGAISEWQNDTGDVGESSKMFTLLATYIKADVSAGGMGISEIMLMVFILFLGILQEIGIAACTPAATIDRGTLLPVARYCKWKSNKEKEEFLIDVYIEYKGDGVLGEKDFDEKCQKSVRQMFTTRENVIEKFTTKPKTPVVKEKKTEAVKEGYSGKVDELVKEIEELI
jgi:hypothetical protein